MFLYSREAVQMAKDNDVDKLTMELLRSNNSIDIAKALAERIINERNSPNKIVVSQEEMDLIQSLFRVRGYAEDGTPINRGRKPKE